MIGNRASHVWDNLERACESGTEVLARITVIPGFNDSEEDMEEFARRIAPYAGLKNFRFELLYYHQYGREKWEAIGKDYRGPDGV